MEEIIASSNTAIRAPPPPPPPQQQQQVLDDNSQRRARPDKDQNLNCPRCNSTNTKFCYYNNYSLSQPRYFCKTCRRYWTAGGSLRNVPVGGGSRKNKRPSPSTLITSSSSPPISSLSSPSSATSTISNNLIPDLNPPHHHHHISLSSSSKIHPHPHHHGQDLNLAFPTSILQPMEMAKTTESNKVDLLPNFSSSPSSALELLRTGIASSSLNSFVPVPMSDSNAVLYPSSGFPNLQELKPSFMGFPGPTDGLGLGPVGDGSQGHGEARLFFRFGDINKFPSHQSAATATKNSSTTVTGNEVDNHQSIKGSTQDHQHQHHQVAGGYWSGMLGGGAW